MADHEIDALVVGAGFGGCYLLKLLRDQGLRVQLFEAGADLGGVWCWNQYPGARVDIELPYYGFSDPAVWRTYTWPERFPDYRELRRYFQHVADVWDLRKDISFHTQVAAAAWQGDHWSVTTAQGATCKCRWFLAATGTSFREYIPDWKGKDSFQGELHHSSHWPEQLDIAGKRVAVVGAGSTGLQVMQEAGQKAAHVTHYIRSPNIALPLRQRQISPEEVIHQRTAMPHLFQVCRASTTGLLATGVSRSIFEDSPETREEIFEEQWKRGGFDWSMSPPEIIPFASLTASRALGCYGDYLISPEANQIMYEFWAKKTRARIQDPQKRDLLAPLQSAYYFGTKRPSMEWDYYEQCDKPHVEVTNSRIDEITETGIRSEDGVRAFDIIAVCTGFDAITGGLRTMEIKGKDGLDLQDKWKDGVRTHVGMMVHGFPNMYIVYGPQAPTSYTNGPPFIELQCEWIADTIAKQRKEGHVVVEAKESEETAWREHVLGLASQTLAVTTDSWYMGANIPGKRREMLLYVGGIPAWHKAAVEALEDWKGFDVPGRREVKAS